MKLEKIINYLETHGPTIVEAVIIFVVGWYIINIVMSIIKKMMLKSKMENIVVTFLNSIISITLKIILIIIAISHIGVNTASLVTVLATGGAAVVLGLKDSLSGIASGIIILITKPFKQGDYIKVTNYEGYVTKIEIMDTYLLTRLQETIVIPNNVMAANTVINYTSKETRKVVLEFSVHYDSDINKVKQIIKNTLKHHPKVLNEDEYPYYIRVTSYEASSVNLKVIVTTKIEDYYEVRDDLMEQVKEAFDQSGVVIPYNQLDIHVIKDE